MPVSLGTSLIVPCATAGTDAVRWPADVLSSLKDPLSPERSATHLADKVRIVLAGPIDLEKTAKGWDEAQLHRWVTKQLEGCPDLG